MQSSRVCLGELPGGLLRVILIGCAAALIRLTKGVGHGSVPLLRLCAVQKRYDGFPPAAIQHNVDKERR